MRPAAHPIRWILSLLAAVIAVVLAATLVVLQPWAPQQESAPVAEAGAGVVIESAPSPEEASDLPRVLVFGDSWTVGSAATAPSGGYAYRVADIAGWDTIVNGESGSGYLKEGRAGNTFGERIARLDPALDPDVVIIQGSINDRRQGAAGYRKAVQAAWDDLAATYPEATIVVLGPAPQVLPIEAATLRIDQDLAELAAAREWPYVSPIAEHWITDDNYLEVIDTSERGADHPSDAGHLYLAQRVAEAVAPLVDPVTVVALEEDPEPVAGR
ncbi:SGNH/GDSL hydrolase family protein [Microbacterium sediminis]|uniref:SGNH/GDSL hydrolase family protein n=1 Tax=Microbacterium sediminis TaxID=904291 RepID=UPI0014777BE7|nr:SGNH/GDSL hydrolase family protein [Microbacterium sediminis]